MAIWGASWGDAWAESWATANAPAPQPSSGPGSGGGGYAPRYLLAQFAPKAPAQTLPQPFEPAKPALIDEDEALLLAVL